MALLERSLQSSLNATMDKRQDMRQQIEQINLEFKRFQQQRQKDLQALKKERKAAKVEKGTRHTVQQGDTLYSLAKRYGVSVDALRRWNNIKSGQSIYPGQELIVQP
jgi:LysM repeat protein